jgi:hypothetical protein
VIRHPADRFADELRMPTSFIKMARLFTRSSDPGYAHLLADGVYEENLSLGGKCEHVETFLVSPDASQMQ